MLPSSSLGHSVGSETPSVSVADHELLHVIGRGGYGDVWLARHTRLGLFRAVKIVRRDRFSEARPFQREFEGIRRYEPISRGHPNLVSILHVGGTDDTFYYVMELADDSKNEAEERAAPSAQAASTAFRATCPSAGSEETRLASPASIGLDVEGYRPHTLRSELKQHGSAPVERCLEIGAGLASALAYLHANGLVHRDVKPSNVIFVGRVPKLADIGLVASVSESRSFVGTEGYIPPEGPGTNHFLLPPSCRILGRVHP